METACKAEFETCYGPDYREGKFSGPCADEGMCTSKCRCGDQSCYDGCATASSSEECTSCGRSFVSCGSECVVKAGCAFGGQSGGDAGAGDLDPTCFSLERCCEAIADPNTKQECLAAHREVSRATGSLCFLVFLLYCS